MAKIRTFLGLGCVASGVALFAIAPNHAGAGLIDTSTMDFLGKYLPANTVTVPTGYCSGGAGLVAWGDASINLTPIAFGTGSRTVELTTAGRPAAQHYVTVSCSAPATINSLVNSKFFFDIVDPATCSTVPTTAATTVPATTIATTTTAPPATDPPTTEPVGTDSVGSDAPPTEPTVAPTDPPVTDAPTTPAPTDPPVTDPPTTPTPIETTTSGAVLDTSTTAAPGPSRKPHAVNDPCTPGLPPTGLGVHVPAILLATSMIGLGLVFVRQRRRVM